MTKTAKRPRPEGAKADRQFVTALARGLEILRCFNASRAELGSMELAHLTGLPQPTVWRLCHTLVRTGYLTQSPSSDKLRIGPGVLSLGYAALVTLGVGEIAMQGMQRLADEFHAASSLAAPDRLDMVIVRRATAAGATLMVNLHIGSRLPMENSSFGWAYLAAVPETVRATLLRALAREHKREWPELSQRIQGALEMYVKRGYVLNIGSYNRDVNAIAVPIVPDNGGQILLLNMGGPANVVPVKLLEKEVAPRLLELASLVRAGMLLATGEQVGLGNERPAEIQRRPAATRHSRKQQNKRKTKGESG
jgi:DNA-binding IclR family transcriptional regulator